MQIAEVKPFTDKEIHSIIAEEAQRLDYDATVDYLEKLVEADKEEFQSTDDPIEKLMWSVRHAHLIGFQLGVEVFNDTLKQILGYEDMEVDDIQIYPCYEEHPPKPEKMEHKAQYFEQTGRFQSEIILDKDGYLIDGYTSYLLAQQQGMRRVLIRYGKRQIIRAYHREGGALYEWELPQSMIDRVSSGDKVLVPTKHGPKVVTVSAVEPYRPQEYIQKLRTAIKVKKGGAA